MKKGYFAFFAIVFVFSTLYAGAFLQSFRGHNLGEDIKIEWETGEEINLNQYIIERKTPESNFVSIASVQPKGNNSYYSYIDESIFKQNDYVFNYRLKIIENSGDFSYSSTISVSLNPSSVKKTWGSIKAMFR
ncbi:MAG: hypothetical protein EHM47_04640 [Ignavibacteriales bacterium]|nr:MAG: hypothetical protein EHM47_04640 [Ignavibacteriales bacterium]